MTSITSEDRTVVPAHSDSVQPITVLRSPFFGESGYGSPPDLVAAEAFLERLRDDPKSIVERFISMCRSRQTNERLTPPSDLWVLADQLSMAILASKLEPETLDAIIDTDLINIYQDLIMRTGFFQEPVVSPSTSSGMKHRIVFLTTRISHLSHSYGLTGSSVA